jgi:N-acetyl-gamma-glutamyl-phosphate reductase
MRMELNAKVSFTPHVIPSIRGILTTAHVFLSTEEEETLTHDEIEEIYKRSYAGKRFIRLWEGIPSLSAVRGTNFCDIGFGIDAVNARIVVISAIDNLVKGGSGQAIQNMNVMFGLDEEAGLWFPGLVP